MMRPEAEPETQVMPAYSWALRLLAPAWVACAGLAILIGPGDNTAWIAALVGPAAFLGGFFFAYPYEQLFRRIMFSFAGWATGAFAGFAVLVFGYMAEYGLVFMHWSLGIDLDWLTGEASDPYVVTIKAYLLAMLGAVLGLIYGFTVELVLRLASEPPRGAVMTAHLTGAGMAGAILAPAFFLDRLAKLPEWYEWAVGHYWPEATVVALLPYTIFTWFVYRKGARSRFLRPAVHLPSEKPAPHLPTIPLHPGHDTTTIPHATAKGIDWRPLVLRRRQEKS